MCGAYRQGVPSRRGRRSYLGVFVGGVPSGRRVLGCGFCGGEGAAHTRVLPPGAMMRLHHDAIQSTSSVTEPRSLL